MPYRATNHMEAELMSSLSNPFEVFQRSCIHFYVFPIPMQTKKRVLCRCIYIERRFQKLRSG